MTEQQQQQRRPQKRIVKTSCNCCGKPLGYEDMYFIEFKIPKENGELFNWGSYTV